MAIEVNTNFEGQFSLPMSIGRLNPIPADKTSVWDTIENATNYANGSAVAYIGQLVYVQEDKSYYKITDNGIQLFSGDGMAADVNIIDTDAIRSLFE